MTYIETQTQEIRNLLLPILGQTTAKTYFSYYGIFKDYIMIGLYKEGLFYLKISEKFFSDLTKYQGIISLSDPNIKQSNKYYFMPQMILNNIEKYSNWFTDSFADIKQAKDISYLQKRNRISSLPNMNLNLARILKKVNIITKEDLIDKGEICIFVELIKLGLDVDHIILFKLYGAINNQFIYTMSTNIKELLLKDANQALNHAGLRKRFNTNL
ncbi:TfoX/Sxy family DNA transformation protein [Otariodibacter sp.]|uniref:TfoX/Sxy family DNA transformation protein n=1 Tax=Otariodibacter sp. TaxID=3030919 RepID=UPI00260A3244|nr:TfoX/Sxy family DNA transformation protein [Otariodibacter sp.]